MAQEKPPMKILAQNRKAFHEYFVLDKYEAGVALRGTEVKSLREGKVNFADSHAIVENAEVYLSNLDIAPYDKGNHFNHEARRKRKLLLHKREIGRLTTTIEEKGLTLVPLRLYLNERGRVKVEIGVCKGKKLYDKRAELAAKEARTAIRRALKSL